MARKNHYRERGTGSIYKKGNRFYLKIRINEKAKSYILRDKNDLPVTTRVEAEKAAALLRPVLRAEQKEEIALYIADAKKLRKQAAITVDEIWKSFLKQSDISEIAQKTLSSYGSVIKLFLEWLRKKHPEIIRPNQINADTAVEYFNDLWATNVSCETYNSYRKSLCVVFKHVLDAAGMEENPFQQVPRKTVNTETRKNFTSEQVQAIFDGFRTGFFYTSEQEGLGPGRKRVRKLVTQEYVPLYKDEMFVLLNLCCWTGCRGQDGCLMKWENIDLERQQITYIPQKTARKTSYRSVTLPIHPNLLEALQTARSWVSRNMQGEDYIIPQVAHRYQSNPSGIQKDVMKIIRCATGLETTGKSGLHTVFATPISTVFTVSGIRLCRSAANAGVPLDVVASIVGHGSTAMTRHYAHISDEAKGKAIEALPVLESAQEEVHDPDRELLLKQLSGLSTEELAALVSNTTTNSTNTKDLKAG